MKIQRALDHFKWKFQNKWKPTPTDVEAYNAIIEYVEFQNSVNLTQNESLAKLWIEKMILLSSSNMYSGERCIQVIDEILEKSVHDWCMILKEQIPMMRFNSVASDKYPLKEEDVRDISKIMDRNRKIVSEFEDELSNSLKYEISEKNIIKFVEKQISRILNK